MKNTIIIYGAGGTGRSILALLKKEQPDSEFVFSDSDQRMWGKIVDGVDVVEPRRITEYDFDKIYVGAVMAREDVERYLIEEIKVPKEKIYVNNKVVQSYLDSYSVRIQFLKSFSEIAYDRGFKGNTAEGGVYNGAFSRYITKFFPDRTHYMFDTFEGFDADDTNVDAQNEFSNVRNGLYKSSRSVSDIVNSLENPEKAVVRKGLFPDTAEGVDDEFVFVHLDFDLYQPTIAGLRFFYPKMVKGGVILIHDYNNPSTILPEERYLGIRAALLEFCEEMNTDYIPIGDEMSVAFIKK